METLYDIGIWIWAVLVVCFSAFVSSLIAAKVTLGKIALCMLGGVARLMYQKTNNEPVGFWMGCTTLFVCALVGGTSNDFLINKLGFSTYGSGFGLVMLGAVAYPLFTLLMNKTLSNFGKTGD